NCVNFIHDRKLRATPVAECRRAEHPLALPLRFHARTSRISFASFAGAHGEGKRQDKALRELANGEGGKGLRFPIGRWPDVQRSHMPLPSLRKAQGPG